MPTSMPLIRNIDLAKILTASQNENQEHPQANPGGRQRGEI
jgi:hypothetical protein